MLQTSKLSRHLKQKSESIKKKLTVTSNGKWGMKRRREYDLGQNAVLDGETKYCKNL